MLSSAERLTHLRVKLAALGFESRQIRREERKLTRAIARAGCVINRKMELGEEAFDRRELLESSRHDLYRHRTVEVRREFRAAHLARGFLMGRDYLTMEQRRYSWPKWDRVERHALKFGTEREQDIKQKFAEWKERAESHGLSERTAQAEAA